MKKSFITFIVLANISFSLFAQDLYEFKIPDAIPKKVENIVNKRAFQILNSSKSKSLTISFLVTDDDIYRIEFMQNKEISINVSGLMEGIYFLQVYFNGKQFGEKIIIE